MLGYWQLADYAFTEARAFDLLDFIPIGEAVERAARAVKLHVVRLAEGRVFIAEGGAMNHAVGAVTEFQREHAGIIKTS